MIIFNKESIAQAFNLYKILIIDVYNRLYRN